MIRIVKLDLIFMLAEVGSSINCGVEYDADILDEGAVLRLVDHYQQLLNLICRNTDQHVWTASLGSGQELTSAFVNSLDSL